MKFAERVTKWMPLAIEAARPTQSQMMQLCLPRMLVLEGNGVGLVNLELAPIVLGGIASTRLLYALNELFSEAEPSPGELVEAATLIRQHLASLEAASEQAHTEHETNHQHGKDPLN